MNLLTRRAAIGVIAGGAATATTGYVFVRFPTDKDLVLNVLERYLGPIVISPEDLAAFTDYFWARRANVTPGPPLSYARRAAEGLGLQDTLASTLNVDRAAALERFDRWVLAEFHTVTDIGWRNDPADPVIFIGPQACLNPFARFDMA